MDMTFEEPGDPMLKHVCMRPLKAAFFSTLIVIAGLTGCAQEDAGSEALEPEAFYDGRNIRWIIPYSPGGGYDEYARLLSPYLEKYTGARIDILNLPGAGGMRGANDLYTSPKNGLTIGLINGSALVVNELAGMRGAEYEIDGFDVTKPDALGIAVTDIAFENTPIGGIIIHCTKGAHANT